MPPIVSPASMQNMIGQDMARRKLITMCESARGRGEALRHTILVGPGGVGKTALARLVAACMDAPFVETMAGAVDTKKTMTEFLLSLDPYSVVFIDEFHGVKSSVRAQVLYCAMSDRYVMGKSRNGYPAKILLRPFTLVAATTEGKLDPSMARRFTRINLRYYSVDELARIITWCAEGKGFEIEAGAAWYLAVRSQGVAGIGQEWLASAIDETRGASTITLAHAVAAMEVAEVDDLGLGTAERAILIAIAHEGGHPIGLSSVASLLGMRSVTEEVAFLERMNLVRLNHAPRGRVATSAAYVHLGEKVPPIVRGRESGV